MSEISNKRAYFIPVFFSLPSTSNISHYSILITELLDPVFTLQTRKVGIIREESVKGKKDH